MTSKLQNESLNDISFLYELSLATNSIFDADKIAQNFIRILLSRKTLDYGAIWLRNNVSNDEEFNSYKLFYAYPQFYFSKEAITGIKNISELFDRFNNVITFSTKDEIYQIFIGEGIFPQGKFIVFKLADIGYLLLFRSETDEVFSAKEISQSSKVLNNLAVSLKGIFSYQRASFEIANREKIEKILLLHDKAIQSTNNGIIITTSAENNFQIIFINEAFAKITGYTQDEVLGKNLIYLNKNRYNQPGLEKIKTALKDEIPTITEIKDFKKNGEEYWIKTSISPIKDENGITTHFIGIQTDITDQKIADNKIKEYSTRMSVLIQSLNAGILMEDENRKIVLLNQTFLKTFNLDFKVEELIGTNSLELFATVSKEFLEPESIFNNVQQAIEKKELIKNIPIPMADERFLELDYIPIKKSNENICHLWFYKDVTERNNTIQELIIAKKEAEASTEAKDLFLANMSHEIRTPMNAVLGFTNILLRKNPSEEQEKLLKVLKTSSENLLVIINDILDYAKLSKGRINFNNEDFSIREIIHQVINTLKYFSDEKNIRIISKIENDVPELIIGDPVRTTQILLNIVSNAIKYTEKGFVEIRCQNIKFKNSIVTLKFEVEDSGIGISEENISRIFESFEQVSKNARFSKGGTGLGLAIVKKLIDSLNGKISVTSKLDYGSTFILELPFKISDKEISKIEKKSAITPELEKELSNLNILVVEDNTINQLVIENILNLWKINFKIANHGKEAIKLLEDENFDLIFMDISMPIMNGFETTQYIRNYFEPPKKDIPICAFTASASPEFKYKVIDEGMNDYLAKPVTPEKMYRKIVEMLGITLDSSSNVNQNNPNNIETNKLNLNFLISNTRGDKELMRRMISLFNSQIPQYFEEIQHAIDNKDYVLIKDLAHKTKPTFTYVGFDELRLKIEQIEEMSITKADFMEIEKLFQEIKSDAIQGIELLKSFSKKNL